MKNNKWTYELYNEEVWSSDEEFDTKEEAIIAGKEAALDDDEITSFYVGQIKSFVPSVDVGRIIDDIGEEAYEQCGEFGEEYLWHLPIEEINKLEELLNEALNKWLNETNNEPTFYTLRNVETISVEV